MFLCADWFGIAEGLFSSQAQGPKTRCLYDFPLGIGEPGSLVVFREGVTFNICLQSIVLHPQLLHPLEIFRDLLLKRPKIK